MYSCAIFGHSNYLYENCKNKIQKGLIDLIIDYKVVEFYIGMRGDFEALCVEVLKKLQKEHSHIKLIRVWAYLPQKNSEKEGIFDGSVYLLERKVPPVYAIIETNKCLVKKVDYIFSGVMHDWGGAWTAVEYARKKGKVVIDALGGLK